jgi:hypothetical protein
MKKILHQFRKSFLIGLAAVVLSTLGIQASDEMGGISGRMSALLSESVPVCEEGTTLVLFGTNSVCMDIYEASPNKNCPYGNPQNELETDTNIIKGQCQSASVVGVKPWRFINYTEASQVCARSGKRLPTNEEWYKVSLGLADPEACFTNSGGILNNTGENDCISPVGVHDMVGNVWEWTSDMSKNGIYNEHTLPESGYVTLVDDEGVILKTGPLPNASFGNDYASVSREGTRGFLRGGFYGSGEDGGIFAQNIAAPIDLSTIGVGFRCVRDI